MKCSAFLAVTMTLGSLPVWAQATQPSGLSEPTPVAKPVVTKLPEKLKTVPMVIKTSKGDIEVELYPEVAPVTVANFVGLSMGDKAFKDPNTGQEVKRPFFDNTVFHRVINNFMIQAGSPTGKGDGNPGYRFKDEINATMLGLDQQKVMPKEGQIHPWLLIRSQQDLFRQLIFPQAIKMGIKTQGELQQRLQEVVAASQKLTLKQAYENRGYQYDSSIPSLMPKRGYLAMANAGPNTNGSQFFIIQKDSPYLTGKHTVFGKVTKGMEVVDAIAVSEVDQEARPKEIITIQSIRLKQ